MKTFGELFSESWKEYKINFKVFLIIFLLFSILPTIITLLFMHSVLFFPFIVLAILLNVLMYASFIYNSLYKKKINYMNVSETLAGGYKYFWKFLLFSIVYFIFLTGLFLLFIIPGIIFLIFWIFSSYVLIGENEGILNSLGKSYKLVKGRWWRTFGFSLLFGLIILGITIIFLIVKISINFIILFSNISFIINYLNILFNLAVSLITTPLSILFFKNFYLDYRKNYKLKNKGSHTLKSK